MSAPTLCMIHEGVGNQSAIAKVAMGGVRHALRAGWKVSVVAKVLDESLRGEVEWLKLFVPRRIFLLKWLTARHFIQAALGGRVFDVVHSHQPQAASLADVFTCHYLTRAAHERHCQDAGSGPRSALTRAQLQGVLRAEDHYYRRWNPRTQMLFCSDLLQQEFQRLYPMPARQAILENACPPASFPSPTERNTARRNLLGRDWDGPVLGYLGGLHERKGYRKMLHALEGERDLFLLFGGEFTDRFDAPKLRGHFRSLGWIHNAREFFAACDVLVVPSAFDPCPLAVLDAVAHGVPVIATEGVGNLPTLLKYGAGAAWDTGEPLAPLVRRLAAQRAAFQQGAQRMACALSEERQAAQLLQIYAEAMESKYRKPHCRADAI